MSARIPPAGLVALFLAFSGAAILRGETVNRIVARVDDQILTSSEMERYLGAVRERWDPSAGGGDEVEKESRKAAITHWVEQQLILKESQEVKNFPIDTVEIDQQIQEQKSKFPSPEEFAAALARESLDEKKLRERLEDSYRVRLLTYREIQSKINISPREVMEYYQAHSDEFTTPEMVRISQILIPYSNKESDQELAREQARRVLDKLAAGEDFADLAREYSQGPGADQNGDMGYFEKGQLRDEVFALAVEEHTGIIESNAGQLIIKVTGKKEAYRKPLPEVWGEIDDRISQEQYEKLYDAWMEKLKAKAYIRIEE
ncbi:MAG: peptidylprolyl isomerase [Candidatus Aureabacteria bacterium]|nr:peptidylprolyl isomerase [Candidatus Auribacterota bacterium]